MPRELPNITADWLMARVKDNGEGCLIWTGYSYKGQQPMMNFKGNVPTTVRRVIWNAMHERAPKKNRIIRTTCGTPNCVDPAHLVSETRGAPNIGRKHTLTACAAVAKAQRERSKIAEVVALIRESDEPGTIVGARYGITQSMVSKIRLGKNWQDLSNPFAGLGAR
jgi:hypothetical protein